MRKAADLSIKKIIKVDVIIVFKALMVKAMQSSDLQNKARFDSCCISMQLSHGVEGYQGGEKETDVQKAPPQSKSQQIEDCHLNRKLELRFGGMLQRRLWALAYRAVTVGRSRPDSQQRVAASSPER